MPNILHANNLDFMWKEYLAYMWPFENDSNLNKDYPKPFLSCKRSYCLLLLFLRR